MNDELQRMWEEAVVAYLNELSYHSLEAVRKTIKKLRQYSLYPSRDSNWAPAEYNLEASMPESTFSVLQLQ
jgi:hypothetical protein